MVTSLQKADFHIHLHQWYAQYGRHDLPWRSTTDPYEIYLSEVMLQQTQVKTVLERFYHPFLKRFPTLTALANAPLEDVLKQWEGLGYYSRAKNLHKAAQLTQPSLPETPEDLIALPGIGKNTAHAISAFAFHLPHPVMEANVRRIIYRVFAATHLSDTQLWEHAYMLLDTNQPFNYNQAMMDIGATICTKTNPSCLTCPLSSLCQGKNKPLAYPAPKAKKRTPIRRKNIVLFTNTTGQYYMEARSGNFLHGLYRFCEYNPDQPVTFMNMRYNLAALSPMGHITQTYSHFQLQANIYHISTDLPEGNGWFSLEEIQKLPVSRAESQILKYIETI